MIRFVTSTNRRRRRRRFAGRWNDEVFPRVLATRASFADRPRADSPARSSPSKKPRRRVALRIRIRVRYMCVCTRVPARIAWHPKAHLRTRYEPASVSVELLFIRRGKSVRDAPNGAGSCKLCHNYAPRGWYVAARLFIVERRLSFCPRRKKLQPVLSAATVRKVNNVAVERENRGATVPVARNADVRIYFTRWRVYPRRDDGSEMEFPPGLPACGTARPANDMQTRSTSRTLRSPNERLHSANVMINEVLKIVSGSFAHCERTSSTNRA